MPDSPRTKIMTGSLVGPKKPITGRENTVLVEGNAEGTGNQSARGNAPGPASPMVTRQISQQPAPVRPTTKEPVEGELRPGLRIGSYELIRELGRGGMGVVFVARDLKLGRRVAIKFMLETDAQFVDRFVVEARATASCSHENIVVIYEVNEHEGQPYMVLEYLEGVSLDELMTKAMPTERAAELIVPVLSALACAHKNRIIHRDLKPENIFVTDSGQVKVLDFGIAKAFEEYAPSHKRVRQRRSSAGLYDTNLTRAGTTLGTPPYMSPEQVVAEGIDQRTDLWAVGVILFMMTARQHPLAERVNGAMIMAALANPEDKMRPLAEVLPNVPRAFAKVVDRCLSKDESVRWKSAEEVLAALTPLLPELHGRELVVGECPYPGLTSFQEGDADRFFGRDADIRRAVLKLRRAPLLAVIGRSGAGKSSFVRAGLLPGLKGGGERWQMATLRPGRSALANLAEALDQVDPDGASLDTVDELRARPGTLGLRLRERAQAIGENLVLFVDQFEELFTLETATDDRLAFTKCLSSAADDPSSPVRVVISMRADFVDRASEDPDFLERVTNNLLFLSPLARSGLTEALTRPAEMVGFEFDTPGLVSSMINELEGTRGALPLLQFAASKMWDARDREKKCLTEQSYREMGGIAGALASHADQVLTELPPDSIADLKTLFRRLVTPDGTRAIVDVSELMGDAESQELVQRLVDARLVVVHKIGEEATAEIVHESLISSWPTLRQWLDEGREDVAFLAQLNTTAKQWETKGHPQGLLWRGESFEEAARWRQRNPDHKLSAREAQYLEAVLELGRRGRRRKRMLLVGSFAVLSAIAAVAIVGLLSIRAAESEARQAESEAKKQAIVAREEAKRAQQAEKETKSQMEARREAEQVADERSQEVAAKSAEVEAKKKDLKMTNAQLQDALAEARKESARARSAQKTAEKETKRAKSAESELRAKKTQLEKLVRAKEAEVKKLRKERRKVIQDLK